MGYMHITLAAIGKAKLTHEKAWAAEYLKRLPWKFTLVELPESKASDAAKRKADEADRLLKHTQRCELLLAFDERGKTLTSHEFATLFQQAGNQGQSHVGLLIGGADGLDETVRNRADHTLSFGRMTLPHLMVRLMAIEQVYRAHTIISGHPYHR